MRPLGELEAEIMRVVWRGTEPLTIQALTDTLNEQRPLAYTTVMTVVDRLRQKGWLTRTKVSRAYRYSASRSAEDYTALLLEQALDTTADRAGALIRFADRLDPAEAEALREALGRSTPEPGRADGD
ncbi:BlaI/MecI/CopY family transcriptional regulator [Streptomyces radicis]|uniref:BlaI/MecI/CopY family transcriptional regulator n=1 Tax=Streptomyces radicis TaxID=1750517 RepID=A0A3A9WBU3_9ACTN|nr:BlaI/MecI/CopY family transcriptional regulator [Streptomyces radicis]RKN10122.1 BlaI/MecI/CopY family transcriptional regulator [Streptomyces radicis]RKN24464.1 BlaI/MecI/CopY family transcriptional regulator [Streptomyces radicis]